MNKVDDGELSDIMKSDSNSQYVTLVNQSDDENKSKLALFEDLCSIKLQFL